MDANAKNIKRLIRRIHGLAANDDDQDVATFEWSPDQSGAFLDVVTDYIPGYLESEKRTIAGQLPESTYIESAWAGGAGTLETLTSYFNALAAGSAEDQLSVFIGPLEEKLRPGKSIYKAQGVREDLKAIQELEYRLSELETHLGEKEEHFSCVAGKLQQERNVTGQDTEDGRDARRAGRTLRKKIQGHIEGKRADPAAMGLADSEVYLGVVHEEMQSAHAKKTCVSGMRSALTRVIRGIDRQFPAVTDIRPPAQEPGLL